MLSNSNVTNATMTQFLKRALSTESLRLMWLIIIISHINPRDSALQTLLRNWVIVALVPFEFDKIFSMVIQCNSGNLFFFRDCNNYFWSSFERISHFFSSYLLKLFFLLSLSPQMVWGFLLLLPGAGGQFLVFKDEILRSSLHPLRPRSHHSSHFRPP